MLNAGGKCWPTLHSKRFRLTKDYQLRNMDILSAILATNQSYALVHLCGPKLQM